MSPIEAELVKATKFKGAKFEDRQEYLAALLQVIDSKLSNEAYDALTDEACDWHKKAVEALESKDDIPDFEGAEAEEAEETEEADDATEAGDAEGTDEDEPVPEEPEPADEPELPKPKKGAKGKKAPEKAAKPTPKIKIDYSSLTGEKDRYGVVIGTKTSEAVKLYEKGATLAQVEEKLGGRHYNILTRLTKDGHTVEKLEGGVWKVTHKNDTKKKSK